jgi:hypothetical protein
MVTTTTLTPGPADQHLRKACSDALLDDFHPAADAIAVARCPASTMAGVLAKAELLQFWQGDETDSTEVVYRLGVSIADDLMRQPARFEPAGEPITDPERREILETYNAWLFMERRLLCHELYPQLPSAECLVPSNRPADTFFFPSGKSWRDVPQPSSRADAVLRLAGVDVTSSSEEVA